MHSVLVSSATELIIVVRMFANGDLSQRHQDNSKALYLSHAIHNCKRRCNRNMVGNKGYSSELSKRFNNLALFSLSFSLL